MSIFKKYNEESLKAENALLRAKIKAYESISEPLLNRVVHFHSPEGLYKYLELKANANLEMYGLIKVHAENATPDILRADLPDLMTKVEKIKTVILASLEASNIVLSIIEKEKVN